MTERPPESALTPSQQAAVRDVLIADRADTTAQIAALGRDFGGMVESSAQVATDDEHDPEGATIAFERAQVAALLTRAREHLADVDHALERLADGTYGSCERCGRPIAAERLSARPAARSCIECAIGRSRR